MESSTFNNLLTIIGETVLEDIIWLNWCEKKCTKPKEYVFDETLDKTHEYNSFYDKLHQGAKKT